MSNKTGNIPVSRCPIDIWTGICCCHIPPCVGMSGPILTCSNNVYTEDYGNARIYDLTIGFCGHIGMIVSGSSNTYTNNRKQSRTGDIVVGCNIGVIVTGSINVLVD